MGKPHQLALAGGEPEDLLLGLLSADAENDVIDLLTQYEYWDEPTAWRLYWRESAGQRRSSVGGEDREFD